MTRRFLTVGLVVIALLCSTLAHARVVTSVGTEFQTRTNDHRQTLFIFIDGAPDCGFGLGGFAVGNDTFGKIYVGPIGKFYDLTEIGFSIGYSSVGQEHSQLYAFFSRTNWPIGGRIISANYYLEHAATTWRRGEVYTDIRRGVSLGVSAQTDFGVGPRLALVLPGKIVLTNATYGNHRHWTNVAGIGVTF